MAEDHFYAAGKQYWSDVPPTINGMLGGFAFISQSDIKGSKQFLKQLFQSKNPPGKACALDCGAGIGRVTKFLLTDFLEKVDMVEQNPDFLDQAKSYLGETRLLKVEHFFQSGLQEFSPEKCRYDIIWIQWVLGYLTDSDLIEFLRSCGEGLKPNGYVIVKENVTSSGEVDVDTLDSSVTRPMKVFRELFAKAGLECYRIMKQNNFPKGIYSVYMFALKPKLNLKCHPEEMKMELEKLSISDSDNI